MLPGERGTFLVWSQVLLSPGIPSPQCQGPESNLEGDRQPHSITEVGIRCLPLPLFGGCSGAQALI